MKTAYLQLARKIQKWRFELAIRLEIRADRLGKRAHRRALAALERINRITLDMDDLNRQQLNRHAVRVVPAHRR